MSLACTRRLNDTTQLRGSAWEIPLIQRWYRLAAEQGEVGAQVSLGFMYDKGEGVAEDDVEALRWFRLAAEQGYAPAQSAVGFMYMHGEGVPEDAVTAHA